MALSATIYNFSIQLSDVDRGVYEALALKVARHPSETEEHLLTRVLAYCLEFAEGIGFSRGISNPDEPALSVRDMTGALKVWIDIGAPDAARLHRAGKAARDYLARIEALCGVSIDIISTGPDRDETIVVRHPFDVR